MKIYGETTQEGEPTPDNPKEIKNEAFIYCIDKNGNKVKVPFDKKIVLKDGDTIEQFGEEYYLFRKIEE